MSIDYGIPEDGAWINYVRCHDDIGWGFENGILKDLGLDPELHGFPKKNHAGTYLLHNLIHHADYFMHIGMIHAQII